MDALTPRNPTRLPRQESRRSAGINLNTNMRTAMLAFGFALLIAAIWVTPPLGLRIIATLVAINGALAVTLVLIDLRRTSINDQQQ